MKIFGVEIDTTGMTLEDLKDLIETLQQLTANLEYHYKMQLIAQHRHPSY